MQSIGEGLTSWRLIQLTGGHILINGVRKTNFTTPFPFVSSSLISEAREKKKLHSFAFHSIVYIKCKKEMLKLIFNSSSSSLIYSSFGHKKFMILSEGYK